MNKLSQIPLDLGSSPKYSFENLILSDCNQNVVKTVNAWPNWPSPVLLIVGPKGSGKTHIGQAWHQATKEAFIDDASIVEETTLFSELNKALNGEIAGLLLAAQEAPESWAIKLPDLKSRLLNTPIAVLNDHDDKILEPILRKLFEDRGRSVTYGLVSYILKYHDRSVPALKQIARELDLAAQSQKTDLTKAFAAKYMNLHK